MTATTTGASAKAGAPGRSKAETNGHFKTIKFKGLTLHLPGKTQLRLLQQLNSGDDEQALAGITSLLGEEQMEKVWDMEVDISEGMENLVVFLGDLVTTVLTAYSTTPGESPASTQRSKNTGSRSRRTSSTTTD